MKFALAILILLGSPPARADEPKPPLCTEEVELFTGEKAKCSGLLVPLESYAELLARSDDLTTCEAKCDVNRKADAEACTARVDEANGRALACDTARKACEVAHVPPPPRKPETHWYSDRGFLFGLGVVIGVGAAVAIVEVAR